MRVNILNGPLEINYLSVLKGYRFLSKSHNNNHNSSQNVFCFGACQVILFWHCISFLALYFFFSGTVFR